MPELASDTTALNITQSGVLILIFGAITAISGIILNSYQGFQTSSNLIKFVFFGVIGLTSLIYIVYSQITERKRRSTGKLAYLESYLHDPNKGLINIISGKEIPFSFLKFLSSAFSMFLYSFGFAFLLGFLIIQFGTSATTYEVPKYQGVTGAGAIFLAGENASSAEVLLFQGLIMGLFYGIARNLSGNNKALFVTLLLVFVLVNTALSTIYHFARYGTNEQALYSVAILFLIGNLTTILTGSIIPAWLLHTIPNMALASKAIFLNNEPLLLELMGIIALIYLIVLVFHFFIKKWTVKIPTSTYG